MNLVDMLFLVFIVVTLYFTILFLLLFFENRGDVKKIPSSKKLPRVSLIIPAYNEEDTIAETIMSVKALDYLNLEILVVDDGSTDKTAEISEKFEGIKLIRKKNGGKASALNLGIDNASGEIVGCVDSDSYPEANALSRMIPYFNDPEVASVTPSIIVRNSKLRLQKIQEIEYLMISWCRKLLEYLDSIYVTPGPLSLYRKDVLIKIGKFDEKVLTEDIEITWRLQKYGYKIRMALSAVVHTDVPKSFRVWWKQRVRWNIGGVQTAHRYKGAFLKKEHNNFGMFIVPFFIVSFILSMIGLALIVYLFSMWFKDSLLVDIYAYLAGSSSIFTISIMPNMFTFFGILIFILSLIMVRVSLNTMTHSITKNPIELLIYLSIYLFLSPINLLHAFIKIANRKYEW